MKNPQGDQDSKRCHFGFLGALLLMCLGEGLGTELLLMEREVIRAAPVITNINQGNEAFVKTDGTNFLVVWPDINASRPGSSSVAARVSADGQLLEPFGFWTGSSNSLSQQSVGVSDGRYGFMHNVRNPSMVIFDPGMEPFFRTESPVLGLSFSQEGVAGQPVMAGNPNGFMAWATVSSQLPSKYVMISRNGIPSTPFVLPTTGSSYFKLAAGPHNFLALWQSVYWGAVVIGPDGKLVSPEPIQVGSRFRVQTDAAANDHEYLVIWPETGFVMGQRVSFNGELLDPTPLPLFRSGELEYRLFGNGNKWTAVSRNLQVTDIYRVGDSLEAAPIRPPVFNGRLNSAAVNKFGQGVTVWRDATGFYYQHWAGTNQLSMPMRLLQKLTQTSPMISGGTEGYMAFWLARGGMALEAAFLNNEGEVQNFITRTNLRDTFTLWGAGNSGSKHLVLFTTNTFSPVTGIIFDSEKAAEGGEPKITSLFLHRHPFMVLPRTNGFLVANTNGGFAHVSFTGKVSAVSGPRAYFASSGEKIWAATHGNNQVGFGEWKLGSALMLSSTFLGKNQRVAAAGENALLIWESTAAANSNILQAMRFEDGERLHLQPLNLIKFFPGTNNAPYEVVASNNGFLVFGMDPANQSPNYPLRRQFMFHIDAETGLIRSNITSLDGQLLEMPSVAGGERDFLMVSTRGDSGIYVAKQWILPTSPDFFVNMSRDEGFHKLTFEGEARREYLLERSIDFHFWDATAYVIPGDILYLLPRDADTFEFFRLRAVPY